MAEVAGGTGSSVTFGDWGKSLIGNSDSTTTSTPMVIDTALDAVGRGAGGISSPSIMASGVSTPAIAPGPVTTGPKANGGPRSFASVVSPPSHPAPPSHKSSTPHLTASEIQRQHATYIIRRAPPDMTPQGAIQTISAQMGAKPAALFESVLRDPQDRRRMYLVFKSPSIKEQVAARGFRLGSVVIKPTDGALSGYIPFPPYFADLSSIVIQLSRHGQVTHHKFVTTSDGIRVAGVQFKLKLTANAVNSSMVG